MRSARKALASLLRLAAWLPIGMSVGGNWIGRRLCNLADRIEGVTPGKDGSHV